MERGWKAGSRSPISSRPIRRFGGKEEDWYWAARGVQRLTLTHKHQDPLPTSLLAASQRYFRPHTAVKKRTTVSPSPARPTVHVVNLLGPQIQTSQLTLEKINTLLLLRTPSAPKSAYSRRRYFPLSAKSTRPKNNAPTKDQSSCTPAFLQRAMEAMRPQTTQTKPPTRVLPRHKSEEQLRSSEVPFQNESIRDCCGLVVDSL